MLNIDDLVKYFVHNRGESVLRYVLVSAKFNRGNLKNLSII